VPLKESCVVLSYRSIILWYSPLIALFGLTWRMLTPCFDFKPIASSLYDHLVDNVLSLCMIMAVIALLVGRSQSFASLHMYWVWALLVHPTPKNQSLPMCPPYLPISILLFQVYSSCFYLSSKLNFCYEKIS
jgi:hypothetical protein